MHAVHHFQLPRALTTTVRGPDLESVARLAQRGVELSFVDLNPPFWRRLLATLGCDLAALCRPERLGVEELRRLSWGSRLLADADLRIGLGGPQLCAAEEASSRRAFEALEGSASRRLLRSFFDAMLDVHAAALSGRVISLGCESAGSLALALHFARHLREEAGYRGHLTLGRHAYENFSLLFHRHEIVQPGSAVFRDVDSVVLYEELFAETLAALAADPAALPPNLLLPGGAGARFAPPTRQAAGSAPLDDDRPWRRHLERFLAATELEPEQLLYRIHVTRNKCYWKKCSFCVQIHKHAGDRFHEESEQVARSLREIRSAAAAGVEHFLCEDEALSPKVLRRLSAGLSAGGPRVRWTARTLADAGLSGDVIRAAADAGCAEILFGLETVNRHTAARMQKVSDRSEQADLGELFGRIEDCGIHLFVNFIYDYPTESREDFEATFRFARELRSMAPSAFFRFNKFALFGGSAMHRDPKAFGIVWVEGRSPGEDLKSVYSYRDAFGRTDRDPVPARLLRAERGLSAAGAWLRGISGRAALDPVIYHLDYSSFGLFSRTRTGLPLARGRRRSLPGPRPQASASRQTSRSERPGMGRVGASS